MAKVVFVTGASSGIGLSIALHLHEMGFRVYGSSRQPQKYAHLPFSLVPLDVRNESQIVEAIQHIVSEAGCLDVLVNNAGVGITGPLEETPIQEIRNNFEVNFFGPLRLIQEVLPVMRSQHSGLIINITSIAGYMGLPFRGAYSSSKASFDIMTEAIRMEVKPFNIQLTTVAPGDFATNIAQGRFHVPASEGSPYATTYGPVLTEMNAHVDQGSDPKEMALAVAKIINTSKPKVHYKVGAFMQKFSIVLKRILPDTWYEKLLMNHYGL